MERSNPGAYGRTQDIPSGRILEGRTSIEARTPLTPPPPPKLQKKRSNAAARGASQGQAAAAFERDDSGFGDSAGAGDGGRTRKASLRNAVRRIFGRRSRAVESQTQAVPERQTLPPTSQVTPPRHGYHRSEPPLLAPQAELAQDPPQDLVQRTLSAPITAIPPGFQRTRSPYAVEFPHSSRLKPLDLGNPFTAPGSQLRRRQTLPSLVIAGSDADAVKASIESSNAPGTRVIDSTGDTSVPDVDPAAGTLRSEKRKSRSAEDMRRTPPQRPSIPRKRSEEIRYWRESLQGSVLRASGFRARSQDETIVGSEGTSVPALMDDPFNTRGRPSISTPQYQRGGDISEREIGSASAFGTELSRDLEDRVAKLESGLQSFRGQLAQMTAERNRRTVVVGNTPALPRRRASSGGRTASMLAMDLDQDLQPSDYWSQYTSAQRPTTSPPPQQQQQAPRTPTGTDPFVVTPPNQRLPDRSADDPFSSPSLPTAQIFTTASNVATANAPPQHNFDSLFEMLNNERSARRKLEEQMKGLQRELASLNYQISLVSNVQSQRSSYYAPLDPIVGSSRLQAFLRDTEKSPPSTAQSQGQRESARFSGEQEGVVSRFSASESELEGATEPEDVQTPHEAYQTSAVEQSSYPTDEQSRTEGGMF